ncbi:AAA family ATPase [Methylorubrum extorquens]|nr:AAA family ATPase [Methylorubrum extorquens]
MSRSDERNVTLVHAENGVGKTTLLNSVYWALFGQVTPRFEQRQQLVNFEAVQEGANEASVEVEMDFEGETYLVRRRWLRDERKDVFDVSRLDAGSRTALAAPDTFINSVIPRAMAKYFFFDGEHAESFAAEHNTTAGGAIRSMLGCDLAELGVRDLLEVGSVYTRQLGSLPGDGAVEGMRSRLALKEEQQARDRVTLADHRKTIEQKREQKALIEEELRRTAGAKEIQALRDSLAKDVEEVKADLDKERAKLVEWIGTRSLAVISRKLTRETGAFIDHEARHGGIPKPYNEIFIQGLLSREECICCRPLKPQTDNWAAVAALLTTAGNADATARVIRAAGRLRQLREEAQAAPRELERIQSGIARLAEKRRSKQQQLEEESQKLRHFELESVREREAALIALEKSIQSLERQIWQLERDIESREAEIDSDANKLEKQESKNNRAKQILRKRSLAHAAAKLLGEKLRVYEEDARAEIEAQINRILHKAARRDYRFRFAEDFTMSLHMDGVDGPIPKSGGENQLMSLAFTAALVDFARSRLGREHAILSPGTVAPLVLDAPIGHLDRSYRGATAAFLPSMAGQVLLLLSSGHTEGGVLNALAPHIGRQYVLVSENRNERGGRGEDEIVIHGVSYKRSVFNQERNQVRLLEVEPVHA